MISYKDNGGDRKLFTTADSTEVEHFMDMQLQDLSYSTWKRIQILEHVQHNIYSHSQ